MRSGSNLNANATAILFLDDRNIMDSVSDAPKESWESRGRQRAGNSSCRVYREQYVDVPLLAESDLKLGAHDECGYDRRVCGVEKSTFNQREAVELLLASTAAVPM